MEDQQSPTHERVPYRGAIQDVARIGSGEPEEPEAVPLRERIATLNCHSLRGHHPVTYTDSGMASSAEAIRHLATLDHVVEILEQLNLHDRVEVPKAITATLVALGFEGTVGLSPSELLPRVLDKQRLLRRRAAAARVKIAP